MKPLRLALSCIGPYVDPVDVDFGRLGEVFLVCGPTGSGKTTLFDAMVYALYGMVPGTRDPSDLVSHYAADSGDVYVDFSFSVGQETWRVLRRPPRVIAKRRGEGSRQLPSEAVLYRLGSPRLASQPGSPGETDRTVEPDRPDRLDQAGLPGVGWESVRDKPTEVTGMIEGMLGLSFDEFTRIILLPQGEFQRFLDMNTGDRTEILEKLFPVDAHAAVSELARKSAQEAKAEAKAADEAIAALVSGLGPQPDAALVEAKDRVVKVVAEEEATRSVLMNARLALESARLVSKAWDELSSAEAEYSGLLALQPEMESLGLRLGRAVLAAGIRNEMEARDRALAQREREAMLHASLDGQLKALKGREAEMDQTRLALVEFADSIAAMDRQAGDLAARRAAWERAKLAAQALAAAEAEAEGAEKKAGQVRDRISGMESALSELERSLPDRPALSERVSQAVGSRESVRLLAAKAAEAQTLRSGLARLEAESREAAGQLEASIKRFEAAEHRVARIEASQAEAAIPALAAGLTPGSPCPVCGSMDHPAPAAAQSRTEPDMAEGKVDLEKARTELRQAGRAEAECRSRQATLAQALADSTQRISAFSEVPLVPEAGQLLAQAETAVTQAQAALLDADTKAETVVSARRELELARQEGLATEARLATARQALASARAAGHEAGKAAGDADPAEALAALQTSRLDAVGSKTAMEKEMAAWESDLATAGSRLADCEVRLAQAEASLAEASVAADRALAKASFPDREAWEAASISKTEQTNLADRTASYAASMAASTARLAAARRVVDGSTRPDTEVLQAAVSEAENIHTSARGALAKAESELRTLESSLVALESARARREALRERGDRLVELASILNGDTTGRRLSFRNFVLARYFSRVTQRASVRLQEMSEGRYDIRVVEGKSRGQGRIGLDLEVMDSFTGRCRPASSLSGGEKFLSSISLALGLSDVITRRSGGISLDSIFIDEGFGSLDDETLDRAVAVLDRIRGQRMIGIVSHVGELRTRIPTRIEVDKTGSGSSLRIIGG